MFWKKRQQQESTIHTQNFKGAQFEYVFDEYANTYTVTSFMKRYVMTEFAARDLEAWAVHQKELFEKAKRFAREFNMQAPEPGCERPLIADWYNELKDTVSRDANIKLYDLEKMERREYTPRLERDLRISNWQRYMPEICELREADTDPRDPMCYVQESGVRYYGTKNAMQNSLGNFIRNTIVNSDGEHIPTLAEWYKAQGTLTGFKKEVYNKSLAES